MRFISFAVPSRCRAVTPLAGLDASSRRCTHRWISRLPRETASWGGSALLPMAVPTARSSRRFIFSSSESNRSVVSSSPTGAGSKIATVALRIGQLYGVFVLILAFAQRYLIFPRPQYALQPSMRGGSVIRLGVDEVAIHFPAKKPDIPTFVYFHGNADQLGQGPVHLGQLLSDSYGFGFFAVEYPGYGLAGGSPSEASIIEAADKLLRHLVTPEVSGGLGVESRSLVMFGQSLGCAVAVEIALRGFGGRLVLLSPFESLKAMAVALYPFVAPVASIAPFLFLDKFDNAGKSSAVTIPTLVMHGTEDEIVPFEQGRSLAELIPSASFQPVAGAGHNDLFNRREVLHEIAAFASKLRPADSMP